MLVTQLYRSLIELCRCAIAAELVITAGDAPNAFNRKAPPKGQEWATTGDDAVRQLLFVETLNLKLRCDTDVGVVYGSCRGFTK